MRSSRRRRCVICHHGFDPDPRVGDRQKVCSHKACQKGRRQRTPADWRRRHPGYFIQKRAQKRADANATEMVDPPRVPPPISELPWAVAQEEFGVLGADFLASFGRKILVVAKDQRRVQAAETTGQSLDVGRGVPKDQRRAVPG